MQAIDPPSQKKERSEIYGYQTKEEQYVSAPQVNGNSHRLRDSLLRVEGCIGRMALPEQLSAN
jgi:hypothetical protein